MRRVCIIETESHYEVVRNFVLSIIDKAEFTIVTNSYCAGNLGSIAHKNVRMINYNVHEDLALQVLAAGGFDYKLTTTPPNYHFYTKHSEWFVGSDLLVHNMNYWFRPFQNIYFFKKSFPFEVKSFFRFCKYLPELVKRRRNYQKVFSRYLAPSKELYDNYKSFSKLGGYIRLDYNAYEREANASNSTTIVIPGTVNGFRDYDMALQVVGQVAVVHKKDVKVILLGRNPEKRSFTTFENDFLSIKTFEESLSDEEYTKLLRSADFGILPLKEEIEHLGILEKKGFSNISGGVNDLVYAGVRGLVPIFYGNGNYDNILQFNDSQDLQEKILDFLKDRNNEVAMRFKNESVSAENLNLLPDD